MRNNGVLIVSTALMGILLLGNNYAAAMAHGILTASDDGTASASPESDNSLHLGGSSASLESIAPAPTATHNSPSTTASSPTAKQTSTTLPHYSVQGTGEGGDDGVGHAERSSERESGFDE